MPSRQRAALLLRDVLGFSAEETAAALDSSVPSVNSALQRARSAVAERAPEQSQQQSLRALGPEGGALVARMVEAWERSDVDALVGLLADDVELTMPPAATWFRGVTDVAEFLRRVPLAAPRRWRGLPVEANGQLAFALSLDSGAGFEAHSINVLTVDGHRVNGFAAFRSAELFDAFGLPAHLRTG